MNSHFVLVRILTNRRPIESRDYTDINQDHRQVGKSDVKRE